MLVIQKNKIYTDELFMYEFDGTTLSYSSNDKTWVTPGKNLASIEVDESPDFGDDTVSIDVHGKKLVLSYTEASDLWLLLSSSIHKSDYVEIYKEVHE